MKRLAALILLAAAAFACLSIGVFAQTPTPRPLPPEFLKRREAGSAFQLGRIYLRQRKPAGYPTAIEHFRHAAKVFAELGDRANVGCALLAVGAVYAERGENSLAAREFRRGISLLREFSGRDVSESALTKLGFIYDELVDKRFIFKYDQLAIEPPKRGFDQNGEHIDTRFSRLSERYYVQYFNQPFTVYYQESSDPIFDDSRYAGSDRPPDPVSFYKDVLAIWKQNGVESIEVATQLGLMDSWAGKDARMAVFYGKQAVNKYQEIRKTLRAKKPYDPRLYVNRLVDKYRVLADLLIGLGRFAEADEVLQMLKEEEFSQFVERDATEIESLSKRVRLTAKERELIDRYLALADKAADIGEQFRRLDDKKRAQPLSGDEDAQHRKLSSQVADVNAAFKLFLEKELVNEVGTDNAGKIASDRVLQNKVKDWGSRTVALYTVITENRYRVIMTTPTIQIDGKTDVNAEELNKKIFAFRKALTDTNIDPRPLGKELYDILIKPIEKELAASGATTLVWSLDGLLRYIPIAALSADGRTYLAETYQNVVITPRTREQIAGNDVRWRALGMGTSEEQTVVYPDQPNLKVKVEALPGSKEELMAIVRDEDHPNESGIIDGRRFLDKEFTIKNLTDSLALKNADGRRKFTVVHLASHFRLGDNWSTSSLLLGNGKLLSLEDMSKTAAIDFRDVELVTLSACNTALTTASNGLEVDSLAAAIQAKSGKAVLASLWSIYDESTAVLMKDFYRLRKENPKLSKAEALQQAQRNLIGDPNDPKSDHSFSHPYFWSGFVLIGNWR